MGSSLEASEMEKTGWWLKDPDSTLNFSSLQGDPVFLSRSFCVFLIEAVVMAVSWVSWFV